MLFPVSKTRRALAGFTLIELLVVLVILALFSGMAVLSIGDNTQRKLLAEAERLQSVMVAAADEAIYSGSELGFYLTENSYQLLRWDRVQSSWVLIQTSAFAHYDLPDGFVMSWTIDGFAPPDESEAIQLEWEQEPEESLDDVPLPDDNVSLNAEGAVASSHTPQLLLLSSAELSVFELDIEPEGDVSKNRVRIYSDGFALPKIRQYDAEGEALREQDAS